VTQVEVNDTKSSSTINDAKRTVKGSILGRRERERFKTNYRTLEPKWLRNILFSFVPQLSLSYLQEHVYNARLVLYTLRGPTTIDK